MSDDAMRLPPLLYMQEGDDTSSYGEPMPDTVDAAIDAARGKK